MLNFTYHPERKLFRVVLGIIHYYYKIEKKNTLEIHNLKQTPLKYNNNFLRNIIFCLETALSFFSERYPVSPQGQKRKGKR